MENVVVYINCPVVDATWDNSKLNPDTLVVILLT